MLQNTGIDPLALSAPDATPSDAAVPVPQETISSPYKKRLNGWAIVRVEATSTHFVARFRSHSDADGHLRFIREKFPNDKFAVVFEK